MLRLRPNLQRQQAGALKLFLEAAGDRGLADRQHPDRVVASGSTRALRRDTAHCERVACRGGRCTTQHMVGADLLPSAEMGGLYAPLSVSTAADGTLFSSGAFASNKGVFFWYNAPMARSSRRAYSAAS